MTTAPSCDKKVTLQQASGDNKYVCLFYKGRKNGLCACLTASYFGVTHPKANLKLAFLSFRMKLTRFGNLILKNSILLISPIVMLVGANINHQLK